MTQDDSGHRRGADPDQPLLDPESFWSDEPEQPQQQQPAQGPGPPPQRPPRPAPPAPPPTAEPPEEETEPALVGPAGPAGPRTGRRAPLPPRPGHPPPRPGARPQPDRRAPQPPRPAQPPGRPASRTRPQPPAAPSPQPPRPRPPRPETFEPPAPPAPPEPGSRRVLELDLGPSWMRGILLLLGVAALAGLLGYLLIGRHAAEELAGEDAPRPDDSAAAEPEPAAGAAGERAAAAAADDPEPGLVTPAAQQRSATLKVTSDPADAKVYIDGELRGVTPTTVRGLPAEGEFELRIELAEHKLWEQTITLDGTDLERQVHAGLITADRCLHGTGFLYVRSQPPGAVIELDGKRLPGKTPKVINDVCAGVPIELRLYRVGYRPWRKQVRIEADDIHNLEAELQK